ncbi:hypothetical protein CSKR_112159 [Clonorchis sinensis]|uniref:Uncharacterized protein n=1 Tax=Clonorchis sinensis TaxID=79923 RepID=A0A419Q8Y5_CLOSI|nr:hypothetical protein CSKR_112159 [Clonorchis sinensis]
MVTHEPERELYRKLLRFRGKHRNNEVVKFEPKVQQVGMNVPWRQLGSGGEFAAFAANGTSEREGTVERGNAIVAVFGQPRNGRYTSGDWAGVCSSLGSGIHFKMADETRDPVVVDHRPVGVENSQPGRPSQALPKFKAWEDEGMIGQPGSEPPAMGDAPVLLDGWRVYEGNIVQRNRATLSAGRTRPPHEAFTPRACYQICNVEYHPSSHKCGLCINKYSSCQFFPVEGKQGQ